MEYSDKALVLRVGRFKEADCWVKGYSPEHGVFTAFAFGGMRSRRRFCGCLDPLNLLTLRVKREKFGRYLCLMESGLVAAPRRIRRDHQRLGMIVNCLKFMELLAPGPEQAKSAFHLATATLAAFEAREHLPSNFPAFFRWRLALEQGYGVALETCQCCGEPLTCTTPPGGASQGGPRDGEDASNPAGPVCLAMRDGHAHCAACGRARGVAAGHWLSRPAWELFCQVAMDDPQDWGRHADREAHVAAARAADRFVLTHTGLHWDRFGYRRGCA